MIISGYLYLYFRHLVDTTVKDLDPQQPNPLLLLLLQDPEPLDLFNGRYIKPKEKP
jgi:hypothetical protein